MLSKNGFTLIELVVAFTLFIVGTTTLMHVMNKGIFSDTDFEQSILAMNLANERMEEIRNTAFGSISSGTESGASIGFDVFTSRVTTVTTTDTDLKDVEVEMQWATKGGTKTLAIQSYVADY